MAHIYNVSGHVSLNISNIRENNCRTSAWNPHVLRRFPRKTAFLEQRPCLIWVTQSPTWFATSNFLRSGSTILPTTSAVCHLCKPCPASSWECFFRNFWQRRPPATTDGINPGSTARCCPSQRPTLHLPVYPASFLVTCTWLHSLCAVPVRLIVALVPWQLPFYIHCSKCKHFSGIYPCTGTTRAIAMYGFYKS